MNIVCTHVHWLSACVQVCGKKSGECEKGGGMELGRETYIYGGNVREVRSDRERERCWVERGGGADIWSCCEWHNLFRANVLHKHDDDIRWSKPKVSPHNVDTSKINIQ